MIKIFCPVCETESEIDELEIRIACRFANDDNVLISCKNCCRVLRIDIDGNTFPQKMQEIIDNDDWLPCAPFLDPEVLKMPSGVIDYNGLKLYKSGSGDEGLTKRDYMTKCGIDPECMLKKMRKSPEPLKVGKF